AKFLGEEELAAVRALTQAADGDIVFIVADQPETVAKSLHEVRTSLGDRLALKDPDALHFAWVTGFPLLEWHPDEERWDATHNPFCGFPDEARRHLVPGGDPGKASSYQYDLVVNGSEIGGGSIRINNRADQ